MKNYQSISNNTAQLVGAYGKSLVLLVILYFAGCPVQGQFVDISIDLHSRIELISLEPQSIFQNSDDTHADTPAARQKKLPGISWTRIRTSVNMMLKVEIICTDAAESSIDRSAAYLNDGGDNLIAARPMKGKRVSFPVNSNTWQITRVNSPPLHFEAWIGVPSGLVRELMIEYN